MTYSTRSFCPIAIFNTSWINNNAESLSSLIDQERRARAISTAPRRNRNDDDDDDQEKLSSFQFWQFQFNDSLFFSVGVFQLIFLSTKRHRSQYPRQVKISRPILYRTPSVRRWRSIVFRKKFIDEILGFLMARKRVTRGNVKLRHIDPMKIIFACFCLFVNVSWCFQRFFFFQEKKNFPIELLR